MTHTEICQRKIPPSQIPQEFPSGRPEIGKCRLLLCKSSGSFAERETTILNQVPSSTSPRFSPSRRAGDVNPLIHLPDFSSGRDHRSMGASPIVAEIHPRPHRLHAQWRGLTASGGCQSPDIRREPRQIRGLTSPARRWISLSPRHRLHAAGTQVWPPAAKPGFFMGWASGPASLPKSSMILRRHDKLRSLSHDEHGIAGCVKRSATQDWGKHNKLVCSARAAHTRPEFAQTTQRGLRPQPKVAITLRRDEHLSINIHQPGQSSSINPVAWGSKDNQRGHSIHVAQFKARHGGA